MMSSTGDTDHWQDSTLARSEEKNRREELWKEEMTFPLDYVPSDATLELFKNWACHVGDKSLTALMKKNSNSNDKIENEIVSRIKQTFNKAIQAFAYKCILMVWFPTPNVCLHENYRQVFDRYKSKPDVKYVDIGCCMGTDLRYVCYNEKDKLKIENVLGLDIQDEFFDIGCDLLFNDKTIIRERFIKTNILEDQFIEKSSNPRLLSSFVNSRANSREGNIQKEQERQTETGTDIVYCGLVFHLLSELQTQNLSSLVYNSFLKESGGIFFGTTVGSTDPIEPIRNGESRDIFGLSFLHSAQSLKKMLECIGFVNVKTVLTKLYNESNVTRMDITKDGEVNSAIKKTVKIMGQISWYAEK